MSLMEPLEVCSTQEETESPAWTPATPTSPDDTGLSSLLVYAEQTDQYHQQVNRVPRQVLASSRLSSSIHSGTAGVKSKHVDIVDPHRTPPRRSLSTGKLLLATSPPPTTRTIPSPSSVLNSCSDFFPSFSDFLPALDSPGRGKETPSDRTAIPYPTGQAGLGIIFEESGAESGKRSNQSLQGTAAASEEPGQKMYPGPADSFTFYPSPSFISSATTVQRPGVVRSNPPSPASHAAGGARHYPSPPLSNSSPTRITRRQSEYYDSPLCTPPRGYHAASQGQSIMLHHSPSPGMPRLSSLSPVFVPAQSPMRAQLETAELDGEGGAVEAEGTETAAAAFEAATTVLSPRDVELVAQLHGGRIPSLAQMVPPDPNEELSLSVIGQPEIINTGNQGEPN